MIHRMRGFVAFAIVAVLVACNTTSDLKSWYAPMDTEVRAPKAEADVVFLDTEPTDRPFKVIGLFAPPTDAFTSYAEAVNAARRVAAMKGADAVLLQRHTETEHRRVNVFDSGIKIAFEAKAIVWNR